MRPDYRRLNACLTILLFILFFLPVTTLRAQLEKVIVETYYISDDSDATDTTGSVLKAGSATYRVYIDMKSGSKLKKIYGDVNHTLKIMSDSIFFNNTLDGQSFAKDIAKTRYSENTVALDTWLTLGQTTKTAAKTYFGILKPQDKSGSFIGGVNNDGGSKPVIGGLLRNTDPSAGIPVTVEDGMDTMTTVPNGWLTNGIINNISGVDSSIFGSAKPGNQFISNNAFLYNSGVRGVIPDSNQVLIAQLTTRGKISFELNVEIVDINGNDINYVAKNGADSASATVVLSPFLKYPPVCGCTDGNYLEYSTAFSCSDASKCKTPIVLGCMDPLACNYDPNANVQVSSLCCYPGLCGNRDISLVCPSLGIKELNAKNMFELYPDPVQDLLSVKVLFTAEKKTDYEVYDSLGRIVLKGDAGNVQSGNIYQLNVSALAQGLYTMRVSDSKTFSFKKFIKD